MPRPAATAATPDPTICGAGWPASAGDGFLARPLARGLRGAAAEEPDPGARAAAAALLAGDRHVGVGERRAAASRACAARRAKRCARCASARRCAGRSASTAMRAVEILDLVQVDSPGRGGVHAARARSARLPGASRTYLETLRQLVAHGHRIKLAAAALVGPPTHAHVSPEADPAALRLDLDDPEVRLRVHLALRILERTGPGRRRARPSPPLSGRVFVPEEQAPRGSLGRRSESTRSALAASRLDGTCAPEEERP